MKSKVNEQKLSSLVPDNINFNKGSEFGQSLIENSLRQFGAARSIVIDKNNRIIAGNKTVENCASIGLDDVIVIETTGKQLVAVKRTDIDIDTKQGRELALADNASAKHSITWDNEALIMAKAQFDIEPASWGVPIVEENPDEGDIPDDEKKHSQLIIDCNDEIRLSLLFNELESRGFECKMK